MTKLNRVLALLIVSFSSLSMLADRVGPEIPVTDSEGAQRNVVISRDSSRTLIAFDETPAGGQLSRVVLHQYEASSGIRLGRETFIADASTHHQRRPALGRNLIAWVEEDPNGPGASLWWQPLGGYVFGSNYGPTWKAERVADVARGTRLEVVNTHVFHVMVWTAPDGRLKAVYRSLIARIGYDPNPFYLTFDAAVNPSAAGAWNNGALIAYNDPASFSIRATTLRGMEPATAVDIAPAGASAPRVVSTGTDYVVFWSMADGNTYAQRMTVAGAVPVKIGDVRMIGDGVLHDASFGADHQYFLAVERRGRFAALRLDRDLEVIDEAPFTAPVDPNATVSLSGEFLRHPMLAYPSQRAGGPKAVLRVVEDGTTAQRRRPMR